MSATHFIAVGASAGGVESLRRLVAGLPPDLDAAVGIVLHISPTSPSLLPQILARAGPLPASHAQDGEVIEDGHIYVAPPDHHLLISGGQFVLDRGATENGVRPAVDALFRSAAAAYGPLAIGVVLSGSLDDGTAGLLAIKESGGKAVVQDPADATHPDMPSSALGKVSVDCVASAAELSWCLLELVSELRCNGHESTVGRSEPPVGGETRPEALTCPDCGGPLTAVIERPHLRWQCTVGHRWTERAMDDAQARLLESALYAALRIVDERIELTRKMSERASGHNQHRVATLFDSRLADLHGQAAHLRAALGHNGKSEPDEPEPGEAAWRERG